MEATVIEQTMSFLYSSFAGFFLGIIYEFFRCFKHTFLRNKILRDFSDVLFVLISAVFLVFSFFSICALSFRLYHVLGLILGVIIYFTSVNRIIYKIFEKILIIFKEILKILLYPVKIFSIIVAGIFRLVVKFIKIPVKYIANFLEKLKNSFNGILKRKKKV